MKFFILIDCSNEDKCNNILCMENVIDEGINIMSNRMNHPLSNDEKTHIKQCMVNGVEIEDEYAVKYLTYDDEEIAIPNVRHPLLLFINGEVYKFFGDYSNYVMRLFAEDLGVEHTYKITDLIDLSCDQIFAECTVNTDDGEKNIRLYYIVECVF